MDYIASGIYIIGPLAIAAMLLLLSIMGKRLGEALELPPYYRFYYAAVFFILIPLPIFWFLLVTGAWGLPDPVTTTGLAIKMMVAAVPMTIAITFAVIATAKYWGWIWNELHRPGKEGSGSDAA
jgi:hypothetical protein